MRIFKDMEKTLDLVGIGECLVEFSFAGDGLYQIGHSGDVLNTLAAARRLGLTTGLISALGDDPFTPGLEDVLTEEQIDLTCSPIVTGKPNGVYFIHPNDGGDSDFHFYRSDSAATFAFAAQPVEDLVRYAKQARAIMFSSIPLAVMKQRERMIEVIREASSETIICFDLNVRTKLWPRIEDLRDLLPELAPYVRVLLVTDEDDVDLFGSRDAAAAVDHYCNLGYREVVYRRGRDKTMVGLRQAGRTSTDFFEVPVPKGVHIVDTVGAGDAFDAGYIAAMLRHHPPYECTAMGNATAACSLESRGGRGTGITVQRVEKYYRPLVKWGTFKGPPMERSLRIEKL